MITEEDIAGFLNDENFMAVKRDLERALHDAKSALHWLHETDDYESKDLDRACDNINQAVVLLEAVLNA